MKKNIFIGALSLLIIITLIITGKSYATFTTPYSGPSVDFVVKSGEGFSSVNYRLAKTGLISSARLFHYYTKYTNKLNKLRAGSYHMPSGITMVQVLEKLTSGIGQLVKVTIPEGKNIYEVAKIFEDEGITTYKEFLNVARDQAIISTLGITAPSLEGYLFPETYLFAPNTPAKQVVLKMLKQFHLMTKNMNLSQSHLSPHEVVILASIVEKETGAKWERPTIAGVYLNRLKKNMRLQADPTTIYGIWENYDGNLRRKHLLQKTDYNTYKMTGLPKGPIANPSLAAIQAVLEPKQHRYLFFVSKNDGTHIFTPTYKEHLKAVDHFQKNIKQRSGKSWRDLKQ